MIICIPSGLLVLISSPSTLLMIVCSAMSSTSWIIFFTWFVASIRVSFIAFHLRASSGLSGMSASSAET